MNFFAALRGGLSEIPGLFRASVAPIGGDAIMREVTEEVPGYINIRGRNQNIVGPGERMIASEWPKPVVAEVEVKSAASKPIRRIVEDIEEIELTEAELARARKISGRGVSKWERFKIDTVKWLQGTPFAEEIAPLLQEESELIVGAGRAGISRSRAMWAQIKNSTTRGDLLAAFLGVTGSITIVTVAGVLIAVFSNNKNKNEVVDIDK